MVETAGLPTQRHAYVEGVQTKTGRDGRLYRLCRMCGNAANTGLHRGYRTTPQTPAEKQAEAEAHPFVPSEHASHDRRGHRIPMCDSCGLPQQAAAHKLAKAKGARLTLLPAEVVQAPLHSPSPSEPARRRAPSRIVPPPGELALVAIAIDQLLALPGDSVSWSLRVQLVQTRAMLKVPTFPTLDPASEQIDVENGAPPTEAELVRRPELRAQPLPAAQEVSHRRLLAGIKHNRSRELVKRAVADGWTARHTGSGHIALDKGKSRLILSATMGDSPGRGWGNLRSQAKRAGIDVAGL